MEELGPFRVNPDGKTLSRNEYSWNNGESEFFIFMSDFPQNSSDLSSKTTNYWILVL